MRLFLFRRDLRLQDNTGLLAALNEGDVVPCFIFDPRQVKNNRYKSDFAVQFMLESLEELDAELKKKGTKLHRLYGKAEDMVRELLDQHDIEAIHANRDYTPFSKKRDKYIAKACEKAGVAFHSHPDLLLVEPEDIKTNTGTPYKVFTPFYNKAKRKAIPRPIANKRKSYKKLKIKDQMPKIARKKSTIKGGRKEGLRILRKPFSDYAKTRDYPSKDTTQLSAHLKFGTISVREAYAAFHTTLRRQLFWRDFWTHIAYHWPSIFGESFYKTYDKIHWRNNKKEFKRWCAGRTGVPIVDAGMRQLNATGFMHNRARMITATFLIKDLLIDWRWGERYFAQQLVDYDPSINNGNWQWCAGCGADAQPYFRIFNPWSQQKTYDPDAAYIKKWVDELANVPVEDIHNPTKTIAGYPPPLVEHKTAAKRTLTAYKNAIK